MTKLNLNNRNETIKHFSMGHTLGVLIFAGIIFASQKNCISRVLIFAN